jgi:hypothetical protein
MKENVRRTMGVEFDGEDFLVHYSAGVEARIQMPSVA